VLAIDLAEITVGTPPNVERRVADLMAASVDDLGGERSFDVVLSDMAPKTSGQRHRDQYLSYELYMRALELAIATLAPGGRFVGKIFEGAELPDARRATQAAFTQVRTIKPDASRSESYEIFLVGLGRK
jgi:23S rRNA (uridine2552-2'-O)-methyltransferase